MDGRECSHRHYALSLLLIMLCALDLSHQRHGPVLHEHGLPSTPRQRP